MVVFGKLNYIGMRPTALVKRNSKLKNSWAKIMGKKNYNAIYALCIENRDSEDLEKRKIYKVIPDEVAKHEGYLRIIDESGEDYLYPENYFVIVQLPQEAQEALRVSA
jgi:hypothetical protein